MTRKEKDKQEHLQAKDTGKTKAKQWHDTKKKSTKT